MGEWTDTELTRIAGRQWVPGGKERAAEKNANFSRVQNNRMRVRGLAEGQLRGGAAEIMQQNNR